MRYLTIVACLAVATVALRGAAAAPGAESAFRPVIFARGFEAPVLLTFAPGEPQMRYVVEQSGRILRLRRSYADDGLPRHQARVDFGGERGLLGLAFDPGYARNRLFYVAYTSADGRNTVARYRSNGSRAIASSRRILLSVQDPYGNHNGGHLAFGKDGRLYTTIGDGGAGGDPEDRSQDPSSQFGKLLALDVRERAAEDGRSQGSGCATPGASRSTARRAISTSVTSARTPSRRSTTRRGAARASRTTAGTCTRALAATRTRAKGPGTLVFPVFEYEQAGQHCTVVGGYVYRGRARPRERGRYLLGDYCSGAMWSLRMVSGKAQGVRREPFQLPGVTSFGEDAAGEIYATTQEGLILRLS